MIAKFWFYFILVILFLTACSADLDGNKEVPGYKMIGETIVLKDQEGNCLTKKNISGLKLYTIDSDRIHVYFKENIDYVFSNNIIRRTQNSRIPNFVTHNVLYDIGGSFMFSSSPRNPSLTIPFQLYADYNFTDVEPISSEFNEDLLSNELKEKLKKKQIIKIGTIGTSISAGAHTLEKFYHDSDKQTYPYLISTALKSSFGSEVLIVNYSKEGSSIGDALSNLPAILKDKNDIVFIEYGMNDHIGESWLLNLPYFEEKVDMLIKKFKENNTDVILVGFFQQNPLWDMELEGSTVQYNQSLANLAKRNNCFFADINNEFSKYSQSKINQDLCGDFMHHPTSFGHLLYYKTIIPVFLDKEVNDGFIYSLVN